MKFIDLSVLINTQTPVFPGDSPVRLEKTYSIENDGADVHELSINTHTGTHIDAPSHMIPGGKTLAKFPFDTFEGRGVLVPIKEKFSVDIFSGTSIKEGDIVLFYTGMDSKYFSSEYYNNFPQISEEVAAYLIERGVKMVGMDMNGPDKEPFPIHKMLLGKDILIIENLTNLHLLEGKEFKVCAFPIKLDVDGSPARVVAEIMTQ